MKNILALCMLAFGIFAFVKGASFENAEEDILEGADGTEIDESNNFEMQDQSDQTQLEMPILKGHPYPFCDVRYQACKVTVNDECKCAKLRECCENCFKRGVFCRALPEVCLWVSLRCQCGCLDDASNRKKTCYKVSKS